MPGRPSSTFALGTVRRALTAAMAALFLVGPGAAFAETELIVYTAADRGELGRFKAAFEYDNKDIRIRWVRDRAERIVERLIAEKAAPKADLVWGVAATSLLRLAGEGFFQPYAAKGLKGLDAGLRGKGDPPAWIGQRAWVGAICFNTAAAKKDGLAPPKSWRDLLDPAFKGKIVMPDPGSTRTGFLAVSAWIQLWGEAAAWAFMDRLHDNVAIYTRSGGKPCRLVLRNGYRAGLSFTYMALRLKAEADGIDIIAPEEGVGWDLEATAIMRGTTKLDAAQKLVDWSIGARAARIYARRHGVFAGGEAAKPPRVFPKDMRRHMIKNDFAWAAANRLRIIAEWRRRYGGKVEPGGRMNEKEGR